MKSILILLNLICSSAVFAQTQIDKCNSVDLRSEFSLKMRNQKSLAWCFAHAAADNIQFISATRTQISAADIAINYAKSSSSKLINLFQGDDDSGSPKQFGMAKFASEMIMKQGYCPENIFPSEDWKRVSSDGSVQQIEIKRAAQEINHIYDRIKSREIKSENDLPFYYQFKSIDHKIFFDLLKQSKKDQIFENIRQAACFGHRVPFVKKHQFSMIVKPFNISNSMSKALDERKSFSIDVYSPIFRNLEAEVQNLANLHTVLVYGRKFDPVSNQCLYLVKNSYGESCSGYDPRLQCDKGYLWFPENILIKNMTSAVFNK